MTGKNILRVLVTVGFVMMLASVNVRAHGDEDHGEKNAPAVSTSANMMVRTARAGDLEVTLKHAAIQPDTETAARVFVTRFETNEPVQGATVGIVLSGASLPVEAAAVTGATPGLYDIKLPPVPEGEYKLAARVGFNGTMETVEFGALRVATRPPAAAAVSSSRARTALVALGVIVVLCLVGMVTYRVVATMRRDRFKRREAAA